MNGLTKNEDKETWDREHQAIWTECGEHNQSMRECRKHKKVDDDDYDRDDLDCSCCGGEGMQENDDPLWHGFDVIEIPCRCCGGTGRRDKQTIF